MEYEFSHPTQHSVALPKNSSLFLLIACLQSQAGIRCAVRTPFLYLGCLVCAYKSDVVKLGATIIVCSSLLMLDTVGVIPV